MRQQRRSTNSDESPRNKGLGSCYISCEFVDRSSVFRRRPDRCRHLHMWLQVTRPVPRRVHDYLVARESRSRSAAVQSHSVFLSCSDNFALGCMGRYEGKGIAASSISSQICRSFLSCLSLSSLPHSERFKFLRPSLT